MGEVTLASTAFETSCLRCFVLWSAARSGVPFPFDLLTLVVVRSLLYTRASSNVAERNVVACD